MGRETSRRSGFLAQGLGHKVVAFFAFPIEVRRLIYTTNAMESVHARLRKILKTQAALPQ